ncbi:MAG: pirin family protein [Burkholderiaceae bacterium]
MKKVLGVYSASRPHWVGDGFPVRSLFSYDTLGQHLSPFLLLDYAGPAQFTPTDQPRGVGQHPHRGFETVTIVYQGEVAHRDSTGNGGVIGPGDVQWMTAASGILHEEFHSSEFTRKGGALEMVQLWVNLPAKDKMAAPGYQGILDRDIPAVDLPGDAGTLRVIAGNYDGHAGPAHTFSPIDVWDLRLRAGKQVLLPMHAGRTAAVVVLHGPVLLGGREVLRDAQMALMEREGDELVLEANSDATVLLISGEPLNEPVVGHGPFVMNTREEIVQAVQDFSSGRFGQMRH